MGTWPCKPRTPQADAAGVSSRAQVLRSCADVRLLIPARARACTHASTRGIKPFEAHGDTRMRACELNGSPADRYRFAP